MPTSCLRLLPPLEERWLEMALSAKRPSRGDDTRRRLMDDVTETSDKKKRLNAEIEESLYRQIKMKAVEDGRSISDITRQLWVEYLSK